MSLSRVTALCVLAAIGCAGVEVTPQTPLRSSNAVADATLVVGEITRPRGVGPLTGFGSLTLIPLAFRGLCTAKVELKLALEARIFDATNASVTRVQDSSSDEMVNVHDTSGMSPLSSREYAIDLHIKSGVFHALDLDEDVTRAVHSSAPAAASR